MNAISIRLATVCAPSMVALATLGLTASAQEFLVVTPPGLDNVEGDEIALVQPGSAAPSGFRAQYPYLASDFSGLPETHNTIVSMAWRPDFTVTSLNTINFDFELRLSTTSAAPGTLSNTFANNTGDDETTVYSGPLTLQTDGAGGPLEGPRPFDYLIEFETPFSYDPNQGNLLVDFSMFAPIAGTSFFDSQATDLIQSVGQLHASGLTATLTDDETLVAQFAFVPEPSTLVLGALALVCPLARRRKKGWCSQV